MRFVQFLPTPSHGGRLSQAQYDALQRDFYPRPHMEGDQFPAFNIDAKANFYPRPHMEGDAKLQSSTVINPKFLPTPSHGGRLALHKVRPLLLHFYPRPHMEGDPASSDKILYLRRISTHALTWRATIQPLI